MFCVSPLKKSTIGLQRLINHLSIYTVAYHVINFRTVMFNGLSARSFCCLIQTSEDKQLSENVGLL